MNNRYAENFIPSVLPDRSSSGLNYVRKQNTKIRPAQSHLGTVRAERPCASPAVGSKQQTFDKRPVQPTIESGSSSEDSYDEEEVGDYSPPLNDRAREEAELAYLLKDEERRSAQADDDEIKKVKSMWLTTSPPITPDILIPGQVVLSDYVSGAGGTSLSRFKDLNVVNGTNPYTISVSVSTDQPAGSTFQFSLAMGTPLTLVFAQTFNASPFAQHVLQCGAIASLGGVSQTHVIIVASSGWPTISYVASVLPITGGAIQNVNVVGLAKLNVPLWVSPDNQDYPPIGAEAIKVWKAAICFERFGTDHRPIWNARTIDGSKYVLETASSKKRAKQRLDLALRERYAGCQIDYTEVGSWEEVLKASHNRTMHTLNGNTATRISPMLNFGDTEMAAIRDLYSGTKISDADDVNGDIIVSLEPEKIQRIFEDVISDRDDRCDEGAIVALLKAHVSDDTFLFRTELGLILLSIPDLNLSCDWVSDMLDVLDRDCEPEQPGDKGVVISHAGRGKTVTATKIVKNQERTVTMVSNDDRRVREAATRNDQEHAKRKDNYIATIDRIADKYKNDRARLAVWVTQAPCSRDFKLVIISKALGNKWQDENFNSATWVIYCWVNNVSRTFMVEVLLNILPSFKELSTQSDIYDDLCATMGLSVGDYTGVRAQEAATHNREVHAMQGNTNFTQDMSEIDSAPEIDFLIDSKKASNYCSGSAVATRIATTPSNVNPALADVAPQSQINAPIISAANALTGLAQLNLPLTNMFPRTYRPTLGGLPVASGVRLPIQSVLPMPFKTGELYPTKFAMYLTAQAAAQNLNLAKADLTVTSGFNSAEVGQMARYKPYYGLNMDQAMLKIELLHQTLACNTETRHAPLSAAAILNQQAQPDTTGLGPVLAPNAGVNFGEACGGTASVFPFGGMAGTIAFHYTVITVPFAERSNVVYMPEGLITGTDNFNETVALFTRMWAPYPAQLAQIEVNTFDNAGANPSAEPYVPFSELTYVPGITTLHIIMPRATTARNPASPGEAIAAQVQQLTSGPSATVTFPGGNVPLAINYVGIAVLLVYDMCEYLFSWFLTHDITSIRTFLSKMQSIVGLEKSLQRVQDIAANLTVVAGVGMTRTANATGFFTAGGLTAARVADSFCQNPIESVVNWPQPSYPAATYLVNATDLIAWNRVAVGLSVSHEGVTDETIPETYGNSYAWHWLLMKGALFHAVNTAHRIELGWDTDTWNNAFTNTQMISFRKIARNYYANTTDTMLGQINARFGGFQNSCFEALTNMTLGSSTWRGRRVTIYDQRLPRANGTFHTQFDSAAIATLACIPHTLPDVWLQLLLNNVPKIMRSFPPPGGKGSLAGYAEGMTAIQLPGLAGPYREQRYIMPAINSNQTADISSEARWNDRLMMTTTTAVQRLFSGAAAYAAPLAGGTFFTQRDITASSFYTARAVGAIYSANTAAWPTTTSDGLLIFPMVANALAQSVRLAMVRATQQNVSVWLLRDVVQYEAVPAHYSTKLESRWAKYVMTDENLKEQGMTGDVVISPKSLETTSDVLIPEAVMISGDGPRT